MKNKVSIRFLSMAAIVMFSSGLLAQEKAEVTIRIKKDGEVVKDTTYQFEDAAEAENALKMMEVLSEVETHEGAYQYNYTMSKSEGDQSRTMVFISKDGDHTKITELEGDSLIWIKEGDDSDLQEEHVVVMKSKDGGTFTIQVAEDDDDLVDVKEKKIRVMVSEGEEGSWTVHEDGDTINEDDENVYIIRGDDNVKVEIQKIMEEEDDGKETKVIVIKKRVEGDQDVDMDEDHDVDVDVKVIK